MIVVWVASLSALFTFGLPGATATPEARPIFGADATTDTFELRGHALSGGESVRIVPSTSTGVVPAGLSAKTRYSVAPITDADFFSLLLGNAPAGFSDSGMGVLHLLVDLTPKLLDIVAFRSSWVRSHYKAGSGDWTTPPDWAPGIVGMLAGWDVATTLRITSPQYSLEQITARAAAAQAFLDRTDKGEPYQDGTGPIDTTPTVADMGAVAVHLKGRGYLRLHDREDGV